MTRLLLLLAAALTAGCFGEVDDSGGGGTGSGAGGAGGAAPEPVVSELFPGAPPLPGETECKVTITTGLPLYGATHRLVCTPLEYETNPPSSGDHWGLWAEFRAFTDPVPREMYVHNLEHGAIVMAYKCAGACPDVLDAFNSVQADHGIDPVCAPNGLTARFVTTPDPLLEKPIALAAWRATYVATCIDEPSMLDFVESHYAKAPENICAQGKDPADPLTGIPACPP